MLGIGSEKLVLLDERTKLRLQSHDVRELKNWDTGTGKAQDELELEFRGSKSWKFVAPSQDSLKSIFGALWDIKGSQHRGLLENLPFHQDLIDYGE